MEGNIVKQEKKKGFKTTSADCSESLMQFQQVLAFLHFLSIFVLFFFGLTSLFVNDQTTTIFIIFPLTQTLKRRGRDRRRSHEVVATRRKEAIPTVDEP